MSTTAKIGAFFLVVLIAAGILILRIEDIVIGKKARTHAVEVRFADVAGLDDKSAARIAGVRVGKVDGIRLLPDGSAVVRIALDPDVELRQGASGEIRAMGLLGDKYVDIVPGPVAAPRLADGARIEGSVPTNLDELTKLAGDIGKDVKELTSALKGSIGGPEGEAKLTRIVDNIGRLAESLAQMVDTNRQNVDLTLANVREFSKGLNATLARLDRILDENRSNLKGTIENADELSAKLKTTADNLNSITQKIDSGEGTVGKLLNDTETHTNLNDTLKAVKSGVDQLNTALTQVNKLELEFGFRTEYLTRSEAGKGYFSLDVMPHETRFYRIELAALAKGKRLDESQTVTVINPDGTQTSTQYITETFNKDQLGLTALMGWRENNTILRAGIIESRGGVGVDQILWDNRIRLTGEVWDFNRTGFHPHLKAYGRWVPRKNFFVTAGLDDILNASERSIVLGAGFSWTDERIKSLLGTVTLFK
jgi:phospholipid/cholesterol/gamma-HCH transport system substrate-binding protein